MEKLHQPQLSTPTDFLSSPLCRVNIRPMTATGMLLPSPVLSVTLLQALVFRLCSVKPLLEAEHEGEWDSGAIEEPSYKVICRITVGEVLP